MAETPKQPDEQDQPAATPDDENLSEDDLTDVSGGARPVFTREASPVRVS